MYSFTELSAEAKKLTASRNFFCACCQNQREENAEAIIREGEDFFWVTGERTYVRIRTNFEGGLKRNEFVPYIPNGIQRALRYQNVEANEFRDLIFTHKICATCFRKFSAFLGCSINPTFVHANYDAYVVKGKYTFRRYCSKDQYLCISCRKEIAPGEIYVRRGMYATYCCDCITPIHGLIGKEYSY